MSIRSVSKRSPRSATKKSPAIARQQLDGRAGKLEPNLGRALEMVMHLMAIPGRSGQEGRVAQYIRDRLHAAGAPDSAISTDQANKKTPIAGETGNLILKLPGSTAGPRRLLMAHMDTVPICVGARPVRKGGFLQAADASTGLGADDRAGVAVILSTVLEILERDLQHPPLTVLWVVQEEIGLHGARHLQVPRLGKPRLAFNWDGGPAEKITVGATGGYRLAIEVEGLASHAGGAPERGISAIAIASIAIAELVHGGWHGEIHKGAHRGTSNVGVIHGGEATNVVTDRVGLKVEARSHDPKFRRRIVREIESAFRHAARSVTNAAGTSGRVKFEKRLDYESFKLRDEEPSVLAAEAAIRAAGLQPMRAISNGGLDANWMTAHGIPTATLGCGQLNMHTVSERLDIGAFENACRIALRLATDSKG